MAHERKAERHRALALTCIGVLMAAGVWGRATTTHAGNTATLALDVDISDGACVDIDNARTVGVSAVVQVGVCLTANPGGVEVAAIRYQILYTDTVVQAPEVADSGGGLDDNPDANTGTTTFTSATLAFTSEEQRIVLATALAVPPMLHRVLCNYVRSRVQLGS